jgi:hypothetical protein
MIIVYKSILVTEAHARYAKLVPVDCSENKRALIDELANKLAEIR